MENNQMKMREALTNLTRFEEQDIRQLEQLAKRAIDNDIYGGGILQSLCEAIREGKEALSAPARQCDVGTAEQQAERFAKYCDRFHRCNGCPCCGKMKYNRCEYIWAQMPYKAEKGECDA